ncbi:hypothetical protein [Microcoleus vaginatus]
MGNAQLLIDDVIVRCAVDLANRRKAIAGFEAVSLIARNDN